MFRKMCIVYEVRKLLREMMNLADRKITDSCVAVLSFSSSDDKDNLKIIFSLFMQHNMCNITWISFCNWSFLSLNFFCLLSVPLQMCWSSTLKTGQHGALYPGNTRANHWQNLRVAMFTNYNTENMTEQLKLSTCYFIYATYLVIIMNM